MLKNLVSFGTVFICLLLNETMANKPPKMIRKPAALARLDDGYLNS